MKSGLLQACRIKSSCNLKVAWLNRPGHVGCVHGVVVKCFRGVVFVNLPVSVCVMCVCVFGCGRLVCQVRSQLRFRCVDFRLASHFGWGS